MRTLALAATSFVFIALVAESRAAQQPAAKPITLESLQIAKSELPAGWTFVDELRCVSQQPLGFFDSPETAGLFPKAKAKAFQTIAAAGSHGGTVLYFEYAEPFEARRKSTLAGLLWGGVEPSKMHPEQFAIYDHFLVILSFPQNSDEAEWVKDRLRPMIPLRLPRAWKSLQPVFAEAFNAQRAEQPDRGLAALQKHADEVAKCSFAQFLTGELYSQKQDHAAAEKAYTRALELDVKDDPLPGEDRIVWASLDGVLIAQCMQGKMKEGIVTGEKAAAVARRMRDDKSLSQTLYNLACAYAETSRFEEAHKTLEECLRLAPNLKDQARNDSSFKKALERKDFQDLVK
ncbi:MAG: tetratricopeptide repeat protein [Planctomycetes bacterium]|nr:tetratricopeptide repeat protein [Planctomycetota bacterium]MBI3844168.1 tetratricopeptide repeat protein [Planctomycetota bacterium]